MKNPKKKTTLNEGRQSPKRLLRFVAAVTLMATFASAQAGGGSKEINEIIVFGASLSDVGNLATETLKGGAFIPIAQEPYFMGRLTNGKLWHEVMAEDLGLEPASVPSEVEGGRSYAWAGAEAGPGLAELVGVPNLGRQIEEFIGNSGASPQSPLPGDQLLVLAGAGANNLVPPGAPQEPDQILDYVEQHIRDLAAVGGRIFLVTNIFDFEKAPYLKPLEIDPILLPPGVPTQAAADDILARAKTYNRKLRFRLHRLERELDRTYGDVDIIHFDKYIMSRFISRAGFLFGIENVTEQALTPLFPGCFCTEYIEEGIDPDHYFWFDSIHASARVQAILGHAAARAVKRSLRTRRIR